RSSRSKRPVGPAWARAGAAGRRARAVRPRPALSEARRSAAGGAARGSGGSPSGPSRGRCRGRRSSPRGSRGSGRGGRGGGGGTGGLSTSRPRLVGPHSPYLDRMRESCTIYLYNKERRRPVATLQVSYSYARDNLAEILDTVIDTQEPVIIKRRG